MLKSIIRTLLQKFIDDIDSDNCVSRATFDNYVRDGFIPKGIKQEGFKELSWNKADLDIFLSSKN